MAVANRRSFVYALIASFALPPCLLSRVVAREVVCCCEKMKSLFSLAGQSVNA